MSRKRQLTFGAINITLPAPHSPERYIKLFQAAFLEKKAVALSGDWVGMLGGVQVEEDRGEQIVRGEFYKYIDLVATRDWFNVEKGKPADAQDLNAIVIPDALKPHFQFVPFVFIPKRHRLVLITKDGADSMSSRQAASILAKVFSSPAILAVFKHVDVVVEPARETLDVIFGAPRLRSLDILVTPPNPDDFEEFEQDLFEGMQAQRAGSYRISLQEADSRGLAPDANVRALAAVAQSNGKVAGVVGDRGKTRTVSTTDHPLVEKASIDFAIESRRGILLTKAREIVQHLRRG